MQFILNVVFSVQCTALPPTPHMASLMESLHVARTSKEVSSVIIYLFQPVHIVKQRISDLLARISKSFPRLIIFPAVT